MPARVDPIRVASTPGGLQRAARLLETDVDWSDGVTFASNCGGVGTWQCDFSGAEKTIDDLGDNVRFESFLIYAGVRCDGAVVTDDLREHAGIKIARGTSGALARELHDGAATGNPSLQSEATDITPLVSPCIDGAIAGLLTAADDCGGGEVIIHVPLVALAPLIKYNLLSYEDGKYMLGGHTVSVDGYYNLGPGGAAAADDEAWIYATGPVEYRLGDEVEFTQFTDRLNENVLIAERLAVLRFDPCCVNAIKATIC